MIYGYGEGGWLADRSPIAPAQWIWRGDVTAQTDSQQSGAFEKTFRLASNPKGTLFIAADDMAVVRVNTELVGTIGSVTDIGAAASAQSALVEFDLTPFLREGENVITIIAANGPFACNPNACTYAHAPAGVVFGGTLSSEDPPS